MSVEAVYIAVVGSILLALAIFIAYNAGRLKELKIQLDELATQTSWASIMSTQAAFNVDFFDELWAEKSPRLMAFKGDENV
jgi:hypothetical protein